MAEIHVCGLLNALFKSNGQMLGILVFLKDNYESLQHSIDFYKLYMTILLRTMLYVMKDESCCDTSGITSLRSACIEHCLLCIIVICEGLSKLAYV